MGKEINIEEVEKGISLLKKQFEFFSEDGNLYIGDLEGENFVFISYPGDDGDTLKLEEFLFLVDEMSNFKIVNHGRFHTTWNSYQIARFESEDLQYYLLEQTDFRKEFDGGNIGIYQHSTFLKFVSIKIGAYDEYYGPHYHNYPTIEVEYYDKRNRLSEEDETNLIIL